MSHKVNGNDTFNGHFKHAFPSGYDLFSQLLIRTGLKKKKDRFPQLIQTYQRWTIDVSVLLPVYIKNFNCLWYLFKFISKNFIFQFLEALIAKKFNYLYSYWIWKKKQSITLYTNVRLNHPCQTHSSDTYRHSLLTSNTGRRFTASTKKELNFKSISYLQIVKKKPFEVPT